MIEEIITFVLQCVLIYGFLIACYWHVISLHKVYTWNRGVCRKNGLPWEKYEVKLTEDISRRGYKAGDHEYCWISWKWGDAQEKYND